MARSLALPTAPGTAGFAPTAPHTGRDTAGRNDTALDPAALLRRVFRVRLHGDIHERAADWHLPLPIGPKRRARLQTIHKTGVLFVHVPKNAGTSIANQLYGGAMRHETIRYYRHAGLDPAIPSFAIWRDPVERFCSAFDFATQGGGQLARLHDAFRPTYAAFSSLDQALDHLEALRSPYDADYVFRPQAWFVCDATGQLAVDRLFALADVARLPQAVPALAGHSIPHLNDSARTQRILTERQKNRVKTLYSADYALARHLTRP